MYVTKVVAGAAIRSPLDDLKDLAPDHQPLIDEIEAIFGLQSVRSFADFRTLLRSLRDAASAGATLRWPSKARWSSMHDQVQQIINLIDSTSRSSSSSRFTETARYGPTGQKLADIRGHALLEAFLQRVDTSAVAPGTDIAAPLKAILYGATETLRTQDYAKAILDEAVTAVRTMCLPNSRDTALLSALALRPDSPLDISDYTRALGALIAHRGVTSHQQRKLKRVHALLDLILAPSPSRAEAKAEPTSSSTVARAIRDENGSLRAGTDALQDFGLATALDPISLDALPALTELLVLSRREMTSIPAISENELDQTGETPDVIVATVNSDHDTGADDEQQDESFAASLADGSSKESRYWLQKAELVTRFAPQAILPSERTLLLKALLNDPASDDACLVVLLSYVLGLPLDAVVELRIGDNCAIGPDGYRRIVRLPANRTCADPAFASQYRPTTNRLTLPLPTVVQQKLTSRIFNMPTSNRPLSDMLGMRSHDAVRSARALLKSIPNRQAHRLSEHHIRGALRRQILLDTQSPLIAYLLTGGQDEQPPMSVYYSCIPVTRLIQAYLNATSILLTP